MTNFYKRRSLYPCQRQFIALLLLLSLNRNLGVACELTRKNLPEELKFVTVR